MVDDIFATWQSSFLVCLLLISAAFGSLAALAMDISIEKVNPLKLKKKGYYITRNAQLLLGLDSSVIYRIPRTYATQHQSEVSCITSYQNPPSLTPFLLKTN